MQLLLICLAGAVGTGARFALASAVTAVLGAALPYGTMTVNVVGSLLMGGVMYVSTATDLVVPPLRLVLTTGFLGGFTTYSAFNYETMALLESGMWGRALANVGLTLVACLAAGFGGAGLARRFISG